MNFPSSLLFYRPICYLATPLAVYARLFFKPQPKLKWDTKQLR